jgi:hypothetical protein
LRPNWGRGRSAFQKWIFVRIEEAAAVRRQVETFVADAVVDDAEDGQQAAPGIEAPLQNFLFSHVQLRIQGGNGVVLGIQAVIQGQQFALLG